MRLNDRHPEQLTPSWYGDSVGHYEGDTLVIDTVGVKTDRPYAMIDLFGTPYTKSLHIVERYRLRDYDDVKDAIERNKKENWLMNGDVFSKHRGKFLQLHLTIEDEGVFTTPWTATLTYVPGPDVLGRKSSVLTTSINIITTTETPTFRARRSRTSEGEDRSGAGGIGARRSITQTDVWPITAPAHYFFLFLTSAEHGVRRPLPSSMKHFLLLYMAEHGV